MVRELIRTIQDLRKEKGLTVNDKVEISVDTDQVGKEFVENNKDEILMVTSIKKINYSRLDCDAIGIGGINIRLQIV